MIEHMYSDCDCRVGQIRFLVVFARVVGVRPCVCVLFIYFCMHWLERMYLGLCTGWRGFHLGLAHCAGYRGCVLD